jgi:hypothetical protein
LSSGIFFLNSDMNLPKVTSCGTKNLVAVIRGVCVRLASTTTGIRFGYLIERLFAVSRRRDNG